MWWRERHRNPDAAVVLDPGDCRVLLVLGRQAGSLHLPDRRGGGRSRRRRDRSRVVTTGLAALGRLDARHHRRAVSRSPGAAVLWLFVAAGRVYTLDGARDGRRARPRRAAWSAFALAAACESRVRDARALLVAMIAVDCTFVVRVLPDFERYKPVPAISRAARRRDCSRRTSSRNYQVALPSMVYYLATSRGRVLRRASLRSAQSCASTACTPCLSAEDYADLRDRSARERACSIGARHST